MAPRVLAKPVFQMKTLRLHSFWALHPGVSPSQGPCPTWLYAPAEEGRVRCYPHWLQLWLGGCAHVHTHTHHEERVILETVFPSGPISHQHKATLISHSTRL